MQVTFYVGRKGITLPNKGKNADTYLNCFIGQKRVLDLWVPEQSTSVSIEVPDLVRIDPNAEVIPTVTHAEVLKAVKGSGRYNAAALKALAAIGVK